MEFHTPPPPQEAEALLPDEADSFGEGLWNVARTALEAAAPSLSEAGHTCLRVLGAVFLTALVRQFAPKGSAGALDLASAAAVSALLLGPSASLIRLGVETVEKLREYGNLLLAVMTSALAAGGGITTSTALYAGTAFFDAALGTAVTAVLIPAVWMYLALSIANGVLGDAMLQKLRQLLRTLMEWGLKGTLYLFTGYMTLTGIASGTADAAAGKAAKLAISGAVPVVGGILSDAADAVVLSASVMGSGAGIWGILTILALFSAPAVRIGCQYLMLKLTAAVGEGLGGGRCAALAGDFAGAMGLLLALVSTQTVLLMVSTFCFLRGIGR